MVHVRKHVHRLHPLNAMSRLADDEKRIGDEFSLIVWSQASNRCNVGPACMVMRCSPRQRASRCCRTERCRPAAAITWVEWFDLFERHNFTFVLEEVDG